MKIPFKLESCIQHLIRYRTVMEEFFYPYLSFNMNMNYDMVQGVPEKVRQ